MSANASRMCCCGSGMQYGGAFLFYVDSGQLYCVHKLEDDWTQNVTSDTLATISAGPAPKTALTCIGPDGKPRVIYREMPEDQFSAKWTMHRFDPSIWNGTGESWEASDGIWETDTFDEGHTKETVVSTQTGVYMCLGVWGVAEDEYGIKTGGTVYIVRFTSNGAGIWHEIDIATEYPGFTMAGNDGPFEVRQGTGNGFVAHFEIEGYIESPFGLRTLHIWGDDTSWESELLGSGVPIVAVDTSGYPHKVVEGLSEDDINGFYHSYRTESGWVNNGWFSLGLPDGQNAWWPENNDPETPNTGASTHKAGASHNEVHIAWTKDMGGTWFDDDITSVWAYSPISGWGICDHAVHPIFDIGLGLYKPPTGLIGEDRRGNLWVYRYSPAVSSWSVGVGRADNVGNPWEYTGFGGPYDIATSEFHSILVN